MALPSRRRGLVDVAVLGAGPAGAAVARLLASWGHSVVMVDRPGGRGALAESLPPSCIPLLDTIGIRAAVEGAGFLRATGNTVWWGGAPMRVEAFPAGALGFQLRSDHLDALLVAQAESAGAEVWRPATALGASRVDGEQVVEVATPEGDARIRARWVLDCTGRTGVLARSTRASQGLRTTALVGEWERADGWGLPDESHTLVESAAWGWGWSVPVTATRRFFTVMLDPSATPLAGGPDLPGRYRALLSQMPELGALVRGAQSVAVPWACDASAYECTVVARDHALFVGDAASFIDPLSSFGVKKALASAWLAAVVVHTSLVTPAQESAAVALFSERERAYVSAASRELGGVSREAMPGPAGGFWHARASLEADELESASVRALREDPAVLAAFQQLRERRATRLVRSPGLRVEPGPVIRGNLVTMEDHLVLPGLGAPLRYVRSVDLVGVLDAGEGEDDPGEMYVRYARRYGPVPLPDFLGALSVLVAKGGALVA